MGVKGRARCVGGSCNSIGVCGECNCMRKCMSAWKVGFGLLQRCV
jgi:hypothetical protein